MSNRLLVALGLQAALKDAEPEEAKKIVDAAMESEKEEKAEKDAEEHPKGCRCDDCAGGKDKKKGSKDGKGAKDAKIEQLRKLLDEFFSEEEEEPAHAAKDKKKAAKDEEFGDDEMTDAEAESEEDEEKKEKRKASLQAQARMMRNTEIWEIMTATLKHTAQKIAFNDSKDQQDLLNAKMILYTISVQENIIKKIEDSK